MILPTREEILARRARLGIPSPNVGPVVFGRPLQLAAEVVKRCGRVIYGSPIGPPHVTESYETAKLIRQSVADRSGFSVKELCSARRHKPLVMARHEAIYLISKSTTWSLVQIGRFFGHRDHTAIIHGIRRHEALLAGSVYRKGGRA
jgi:hypothetical protein